MANHENILKAASEYGAVMFKGFDIRTGQEWASLLPKLGLQETEYVGGNAVRKLIVGSETNKLRNMQVLTTNESPPSEPIPFHHELAQTPFPPSHILFYCKINEGEGGSTPILRSDIVYDYLSSKYPDFVKTIEEKGVQYNRVAPAEDDPSSALGRSWRSMYWVKTKEEAEVEMKKQEVSWEWLANDDVRIMSKVLPAVITSTNGKKTFHN